MDEIVDYHGEEFSLQAYPPAPDSVLFSLHGNCSSSERLEEMGVANNFRSQPPRQPYHRSYSQPVRSWSGSMFDSSSSSSTRLSQASQSDSAQYQLQASKEKVEELTKANMILQTRLETLEGVLRLIAPGSLTGQVHSPSASLPGSSSPFLTGSSFAGSSPFTGPSLAGSPFLTGSTFSVPVNPLKREDYPAVKYWYKQDWVNHLRNNGNTSDMGMAVRGKSLIAKGINKTVKYIEDTEGKPVDGYKVRDIRSHARAIWANFQTIGRVPSSWGKADAETATVYRREMRLKFFEFALCENDWKADLLATESYPSWYSNHIKSNEIKGESTDSTLPIGLKRPAATEMPKTAPYKKTKLRNPLLERNPGTISTNIIPSTSVDNHALPSLVVTQTTPVDDDVGFGDDLIVLETFGAEEDHSSLPIEDNRVSTTPLLTTAFLAIPSAATLAPVPVSPVPTVAAAMTSASKPIAPTLTLAAATATIEDNQVTSTPLPTAASLAIPSPATPAPEPVSPVPTVAAAMTSTRKPIAPMAAATATISNTLEVPQVPPIPSAPILTMAATATASNTLEPVLPTPSVPILTMAATATASNTLEPVLPTPSVPILTMAVATTVSNTLEPVPSIPSTPTSTLTTAAATATVSNALGPPDPTTTSTNMQKKSQTSVTKKGAKMRPNSSATPRNLCARDWCAEHPDGTAAEFKHYYDHEIPNDLKKTYEQRSKEAKAREATHTVRR